jgi:hypothetical protein
MEKWMAFISTPNFNYNGGIMFGKENNDYASLIN